MKSRFLWQILIPKHLYKSIYDAMDELFSCFPDHYPHEIENLPDSWNIGLAWPEDPNWFVDPLTFEVARNLYSIEPSQIISYFEYQCINQVHFLFSLNHSRAVQALSNYLATSNKAMISHIVHIDDHSDLMPIVSLTSFDRSRQKDLFEDFDLRNPASITRAIDFGVISKGNFLTSAVLYLPNGTIYYVRDDHDETSYCLESVEEPFNLAGKELMKKGLHCTQDIFCDDAWVLHKVSRVPLHIDSTASVWLDIDMDAFCNRYDGNSENSQKPATQKEYQLLQSRLMNTLDNLSKCNWIPNIKVVTIAVSPSFFPSDYWVEFNPLIQTKIIELIRKSC